jgi:hypothetical protein
MTILEGRDTRHMRSGAQHPGLRPAQSRRSCLERAIVSKQNNKKLAAILEMAQDRMTLES